MKAILALALLVPAIELHAADKVKAIDLMDAEYAARCAAIHITLTLGEPDDAPEVGRNRLRATFFSLHRRVTVEAVRNYVPWSVDLRKNDSGSFINWMTLCDDAETALIEVYKKHFQPN